MQRRNQISGIFGAKDYTAEDRKFAYAIDRGKQRMDKILEDATRAVRDMEAREAQRVRERIADQQAQAAERAEQVQREQQQQQQQQQQAAAAAAEADAAAAAAAAQAQQAQDMDVDSDSDEPMRAEVERIVQSHQDEAGNKEYLVKFWDVPWSVVDGLHHQNNLSWEPELHLESWHYQFLLDEFNAAHRNDTPEPNESPGGVDVVEEILDEQWMTSEHSPDEKIKHYYVKYKGWDWEVGCTWQPAWDRAISREVKAAWEKAKREAGGERAERELLRQQEEAKAQAEEAAEAEELAQQQMQLLPPPQQPPQQQQPPPNPGSLAAEVAVFAPPPPASVEPVAIVDERPGQYLVRWNGPYQLTWQARTYDRIQHLIADWHRRRDAADDDDDSGGGPDDGPPPPPGGGPGGGGPPGPSSSGAGPSGLLPLAPTREGSVERPPDEDTTPAEVARQSSQQNKYDQDAAQQWAELERLATLSAIIPPPPNETPEERSIRLAMMKRIRDAKKIVNRANHLAKEARKKTQAAVTNIKDASQGIVGVHATQSPTSNRVRDCKDLWDTIDRGPGHTVRDGLVIAHTNIVGAPANMDGLFTTQPIEAGKCIGFYTGEWFREAEYLALGDWQAREEYAVTAAEIRLPQHPTERLVISPPPAQPGNPKPDLQRYKLAAINEPPDPKLNMRRPANVYAVSYKIPGVDEVPPGCEELVGGFSYATYMVFAMFACRDIPAGSELYWNYGPRYNRKGLYTPGRKCELAAGKIEEDVKARAVNILKDAYGFKYAMYDIHDLENFMDT